MRDAGMRQRVVELCLDLARRGFLAGTGGNVALRIDTEHFAVTPSATDYETMTAADVSVMRLADARQVEGARPPSVESALHARVFRLRPDCDCSIHTHQPVASACALLGEPLPVHDAAQRVLLGPEVRVVGYAPSGTGWLAAKLARALCPEVNAYLMRNHGVLCCGRDAATAVQSVVALEAVAAGRLHRCIAAQAAAQPGDHPALRRILRALEAPVRPLTHPMSVTVPTSSTAISAWPDTEALYRRFDALVRQPMRPLRRDAMERVLRWFDERCAGSKRLADQAQRVIPGGVQHNLSFNHPFPLAIAKAEGAHLLDVDGNRYIDFLQAGGPTLLGSNYEPVRRRVHALLDECGPVTGLLHEAEVKLAELVCQSMPAVEMLRLLGSGTEAVMGAIRLARAYTKRRWVIKIGGAYHGWSDQVVYGMRLPGTGRMEAVGIPRGSTAHTQECHPNDLDALRRKLQLNRLRGGTAAVLLEPLGPESGTRPVHRDYNAQVRALCDEFGALLIFDEVVSGFRVGMGGAQGYFGVKPDLTVLGKCLAGGYPMAGAIGGRRDVMMLLVGGIGSTARRAFVGGTLSANPLSCVAGYHALLEAQRLDAAAVAGRAGDRLRRGLEQIIERLKLPYVVYNMGSIVHLQTSGVLLLDTSNPLKLLRLKNEAKARKHMMEEMGAAYCAHGLITLAGSRIYTSLADTDEVIDEALNRFEDVFKLV